MDATTIGKVSPGPICYKQLTATLLHHEPQRPNETDPEYLIRSQQQESLADEFSLAALVTLDQNHSPDPEHTPGEFVASGAPRLFMAWILSMEGSKHALGPGTHPLDHRRAMESVKYIASHIETLDLTENQRAELLPYLFPCQ